KAYYAIINDAKAKGLPLSDAERARIKAAADEYGDIAEHMKIVNELQHSLSDGMADLILNWKNFGTTATGVINNIAKEILKARITDPLSSSIIGSLDSSFFHGTTLSQGFGDGAASRTVGGFFSGLGFASGGNPPVGKASIVGENGPELFVPNTQGTIVPNT